MDKTIVKTANRFFKRNPRCGLFVTLSTSFGRQQQSLNCAPISQMQPRLATSSSQQSRSSYLSRMIHDDKSQQQQLCTIKMPVFNNAPISTRYVSTNGDGNTAGKNTNAHYQKKKPAAGGEGVGRTKADPTAKRPNKVCDPYGQGGKPLDYIEANNNLLTILDPERWNLIFPSALTEGDSDKIDNSEKTPTSIRAEFYHTDFYTASKFLSQIAALAHNHNHYPILKLERRLLKKEKSWRVVTSVECTTPPLGGLSYHDFHLAMLIDVEVDRAEVRDLWIRDDEESLRRHV